MNLNFELVLCLLVLISGLIVAYDVGMQWIKRRKLAQATPVAAVASEPAEAGTESAGQAAKPSLVIDYARSFFPVLLLVLVLRSFLFEPFRIPSVSLEPTLLVGDFILVNKYDYGIRLPVLGKEIIPVGTPQRGDIMVFRYPLNPNVDFIKRVVGVPGDHITYENKTVYVNGEPAVQTHMGVEDAPDRFMPRELKEENLFGVKHAIYLRDDVASDNLNDIVVPPHHYFMVGDNRDESSDSRTWGYVPEDNIVGKAFLIWFSIDTEHWQVRWDRIGKKIL
jgi:signal peptidase I